MKFSYEFALKDFEPQRIYVHPRGFSAFRKIDIYFSIPLVWHIPGIFSNLFRGLFQTIKVFNVVRLSYLLFYE